MNILVAFKELLTAVTSSEGEDCFAWRNLNEQQWQVDV